MEKAETTNRTKKAILEGNLYVQTYPDADENAKKCGNIRDILQSGLQQIIPDREVHDGTHNARVTAEALERIKAVLEPNESPDEPVISKKRNERMCNCIMATIGSWRGQLQALKPQDITDPILSDKEFARRKAGICGIAVEQIRVILRPELSGVMPEEQPDSNREKKLPLTELLRRRQQIADDSYKSEARELTKLRQLSGSNKLCFAVLRFENWTTGEPICALCGGLVHGQDFNVGYCCTVGIGNDQDIRDQPICDACAESYAPVVLAGVKATREDIAKEQRAILHPPRPQDGSDLPHAPIDRTFTLRLSTTLLDKLDKWDEFLVNGDPDIVREIATRSHWERTDDIESYQKYLKPAPIPSIDVIVEDYLRNLTLPDFLGKALDAAQHDLHQGTEGDAPF